jgi:hypothetical protein
MMKKGFKEGKKNQFSRKTNFFHRVNSKIILSMGENIKKIQFKGVKNLSQRVSSKLMEEYSTPIQATKMIILEEKEKQDKNKSDTRLTMFYQKEILLEVVLMKMLILPKKAKEEKNTSHKIIFKVVANLKGVLHTQTIIMEEVVKQAIEILEIDLIFLRIFLQKKTLQISSIIKLLE